MKTPFETLELLKDAESQVENLRSQFLRSMGWEYTCDTGSLWLWRKVIDGKEIRVDASSAMWLAEGDVKLPYDGESQHDDGYDGPCGCDTCMSCATE